MSKETRVDCDVCGGEGYYPIYDMHGSHRYSIKCPECYGLGKVEPEPTKAEVKS